MDETQAKIPVTENSAVRELASDASSRKRFFKMMGGAGAASAFALLVAACGSEEQPAPAPTTGGNTDTGGGGGASSGDLEILNYALTLEFLEADFYQQVIDSGEIKDQMIADIAVSFGENEQEHVDALTATIEQMGGTPLSPMPSAETGYGIETGGRIIHEIGVTRMGSDPASSVVNRHCQAHDVKNLFVADGGPFVSNPDKNVTWTILALAMRTAEHIAAERKKGSL